MATVELLDACRGNSAAAAAARRAAVERGAVEALLVACRDEPESACAGLAAITFGCAEARQAIHEMGGVPVLVAALGNPGAERAAAAALWNVTVDSPRNVSSLIAHPSGVTSLLAVLEHAWSTPAVVAAMGAISELSAGAEGKRALRDAGAVRIVAACLAAGLEASPSAARNAAATLCRLTFGSARARAALRDAGGIEALTARMADALRNDDVSLARWTAGALWNACVACDDNRERVVACGGLDTLVEICHEAATEGSGRTTATQSPAVRYACGALGELARHSPSRDAFRTAGAIEVLAGVLRESPAAEAASQAAAALRTCIFDNDANKDALRAAGGVAIFVRVLRAESEGEEVADSEVGASTPLVAATTVRAVAGALWNLTLGGRTNRRAILRAGGAAALVGLLRRRGIAEETRGVAAAAIADLAADAEGKEAIRAAGGVRALLSCWAIRGVEGSRLSAEASAARAKAVRALGAVSAEAPAVKAEVVRCDGVRRLIDLLEDGNDDAEVRAAAGEVHVGAADDTRTACCAALRALTYASATLRTAVGAEGGVVELLRAVRSAAGHVQLVSTACGALWNCCIGNARNVEAARSRGGIDAVVCALSTDGRDAADARTRAAGALGALLDSSEAREEAVSAGAPAALCAALASNSQSERQEAASAMRALAYDSPPTCAALVGAGAVPALISAARRASPGTVQQWACGALWNIAVAGGAEAKDALLAHDAVPVLASLARSGGREIARRAAGALRALGVSDKEAGVVASLADEQHREAAAGAEAESSSSSHGAGGAAGGGVVRDEGAGESEVAALRSQLDDALERLRVAEGTCPVCLDAARDMAFLCGHRVCSSCGADLATCPLCRRPVTHRIHLWD